MKTEPLDIIPIGFFFLGAILLALLALECGYRLGKWQNARASGEKEAPVGAMVGSILGLVAIILAFTFNLAAARFDARRHALLEEANAVGTTLLRSGLLPEPFQSEISALLREYVDLRLWTVREGQFAEGIAQSESLQEKLWAQALAAAGKPPPSPITSLFIQSLNQVIDLHAKRVFLGLENRIPLSIWLALFLLEVVGMMAMGYQAGLSGTQRSPMMILLAGAFACVLFLIVDLDRPQEGFLRVSQQALVDLQRNMQTPGH